MPPRCAKCATPWTVCVTPRYSSRIPYKVTNYGTNQTREMRAYYSVEDQESINVPAGTFRTYRILYTTDTVWGYLWWSPELGVTVRAQLHRNAGDPAGPGTRQSDLLRANIKR